MPLNDSILDYSFGCIYIANWLIIEFIIDDNSL